jgi:peptide/nickel transport system permease protein
MTTADATHAGVQAPANQTESEEALRYYSATQFQLIWWRFRKHRVALTGGYILITMALLGIFSEFLAPYTGTTRSSETVLVGPQIPRFCNDDGCTLRPFLDRCLCSPGYSVLCSGRTLQIIGLYRHAKASVWGQ